METEQFTLMKQNRSFFEKDETKYSFVDGLKRNMKHSPMFHQDLYIYTGFKKIEEEEEEEETIEITIMVVSN